MIKTHDVFGRMNWKPVCSRRRSKSARSRRQCSLFSPLFAAALTSDDPADFERLFVEP
jgi:hypothetical protein